jgi:phage/plasmid-associated DNA primase
MFEKYLDEVLPNRQLQKIIAEYFGYLFVSNRVLKLEKALILYGTGANGKSVIFEVLERAVGRQRECVQLLAGEFDRQQGLQPGNAGQQAGELCVGD